METEARRDLEVLEAIAANQRITQRGMAAKMGIALGLINIYLRRLVRKGYVKCVNLRSNRIRYLITPQGIAQKTRLTYEYMDYSLQLYGQVRRHLRNVLTSQTRAGMQRVAIYGTGEAAELAYLSLKEVGLEPTAIFAASGTGLFLGMPVQAMDARAANECDVLILATLESPQPLVAQMVRDGVAAEKLLTLRPLVDGPAILSR